MLSRFPRPATLAAANVHLSRVERDQRDLQRASRPDDAPRGLAWGKDMPFAHKRAALHEVAEVVAQAQAWVREFEDAAEAQKVKAKPATPKVTIPVAVQPAAPAEPPTPQEQIAQLAARKVAIPGEIADLRARRKALVEVGPVVSERQLQAKGAIAAFNGGQYDEAVRLADLLGFTKPATRVGEKPTTSVSIPVLRAIVAQEVEVAANEHRKALKAIDQEIGVLERELQSIEPRIRAIRLRHQLGTVKTDGSTRHPGKGKVGKAVVRTGDGKLGPAAAASRKARETTVSAK